MTNTKRTFSAKPDIQVLIQKIKWNTPRAQCSPRHACPLKGALLIQVQDQLQGAPVLVLAGDPVSLKRMQNHAPYACMAFICKNGGIVGDF
ncbi:hypothetical protein [Enterobacter hormaechei]|uniref:hypothetical protein n=1 Tax=Enterobacter hormaechei TaxID=158836 RepID=UPI001F3CE051|nr:hypothetical protein [Enterobacter hormaechei]